MFCDELLDRQKIGQRSQRSATMAANLILRAIFGRCRRERRGVGEEEEEGLLRTVDRALESFQEFSVKGSACRSAGGAPDRWAPSGTSTAAPVIGV